MKRKIPIQDQNGATLVEFAIIAPLLFLLIFGIIEFSLLLYNKHIITHSSREGARAGIVARADRFIDPTDNSLDDDIDIVSTVEDWIANHLVTFGGDGEPDIEIKIGKKVDIDNDGVFETIGDCNSVYSIYPIDEFPSVGERCLTSRCCLEVIVEYEYHFLVFPNLMELIGGNITDNITLRGETVMLME